MIKNYLKVAWRNLIKNKTHTFINVAGLSVGMAVAMLIGLWIWDELSYDKNFDNHDKVSQIMQHQTINGETLTGQSIPIPLGTLLRQDYTGANKDFKYVSLSSWTFGFSIANGDKKLTTNGNFAQPEFAEMLSLKMLKGTRGGLKDPSSMLISAKLAKALFGDADPMEKIVKLNNQYDLKVAGVYEDIPKNATFNDMALVASWDYYLTTQSWLQRATTRWGNNSFQLFVQLNPGADINKVNTRIAGLKQKFIAAQGDLVGAAFKPVVFMHPMDKWHLYSEFKQGKNTGGAIQWVWMFGIVGAFVLLLACINFMNLSTARSEKRAREVGIRKAVGSVRSQIIAQFFSESLLVVAFAFVFCVVLVLVTLPWFNQVASKNMGVLWANPVFWLMALGFSLLTGVIAGSYPALYLSSFQPVKVLKGTFKAGKYAAVPRKMLVVLQFFVSVTLIICTIIVFRQVQFTKQRPVGYNRTGLLQLDMRTDAIHKSINAVRSDLFKSGAVIEIAESTSPLTEVWSNNSGASWRGKAPDLQDDFGTIAVSPEFGKTAAWQIVQGRDFNKNFISDTSAIIINESSAKFMGFKNPIGEIVNWDTQKFKIIGVVKDMVMSSPYEPVKTTIFSFLTQKGDVVDIRLNPKLGTHDALQKIEAIFKRYDPGSPFDYHFTDEEYSKKFATEERVGKLAGFFTLLAIFISCMGLFGMASFMAEQRTKEIGVRKVLGASVFSLWQMMSKDFVGLVCVAVFCAIPVAYYFMHGWLQDYKYRADLSWWIFAGTAVGAIVITLCTVSYQSIKASLANPVKSLRSE